MKTILSRKGFDSGSGGRASPIMPDGTLLSLPIPDKFGNYRYQDLNLDHPYYKNYYGLMNDLGVKFNKIGENCHLDPDLIENVVERKKGWKPLFGQSGYSQSHLEKMGVKEGDLFLFFGKFNQTIEHNGRLHFSSSKNDVHMIYGYLKVGHVWNIQNEMDTPLWMKHHPHISDNNEYRSKNAIYEASKYLINSDILGAGVFSFDKELVLTKKGCSSSIWNLPDFFRDVKISYHTNTKAYGWKGDYFQSAKRGQEFVIQDNPEIETWAINLIKKHAVK